MEAQDPEPKTARITWMQPLRVLVTGPHPPPNGGIATVVRDTLSLKFPTAIQTISFDIGRVKKPSGILFRIAQAITGRLGPFGLWGIGTLWLLRAFGRALDQHRVDVVHIHSAQDYNFWTSALQARMARRRGIASVLHFHASRMDVFYDALPWHEARLFKRFLGFADTFITLSESWRRWYRQFIPEELLEVVPNCIEWKRFQPREPVSEPERPRVLFAGMMSARRKGAHDLVAIIPRVLGELPDTEFLLAGLDREGLEANLSVNETTRAALRFVGDLDRDGIVSAYHSSSVFVLPSYHEGMPMVMLEAMAAGLPVICSNVNAIPEVVKDGINGFLIEPGDRDALASRIIELLRDDALRRRLGEAARARVRDDHDLASQARRLDEIYRKAVSRRKMAER